MAEIGGISVKLSADVDASGTVKGMSQIEAASDKIQQEFKETEAAAKSANSAILSSTTATAKASSKVTSAFRAQKGAATQLGYQLQDVAVMAQYGADKFVILGQQGSQIASIFGPAGAAFGAFLAIGAAIAGVAMKMDAASKETEDLAGKLKDLAETSKLTAAEQEYLNQINSKSTAEKKDRAKAIEEEIAKQEGLIKTLEESASGYGRMAKASKTRLESGSVDEMNEKLVKLRAELSYINKLVANDRQSLDLDVEGGDDGIQKRVEAVRDGISKERELYEAWRQTKAAVTAGIISDEQAQLIQADIATQQRINASFESTKARLEEESKLLLENQTLTSEEKAARQAEIDAAALEADRIHKDLLKKQAIEYAQATADEEKAIEKNKMAAIQSMRTSVLQNFMNLLDQFAGESRVAAIAAIAINKGLALAQNTQNTLVAQTRALAELGPIAGPPVAAKIGAYGSINAGLIAATGLAQAAGLGGSSSSALTSSGGVAAVNTTSSVGGGSSSSQAINISLAGSANYTSADIYGLIDQLNEAASDGYTLNYSGG
jgi:hypothetical protein